MIPVKFDSTHWCAIVVSVKSKTICFYDSLDPKQFVGPVCDIARHLKRVALQSYSAVHLQNPV